MDLRQLPTILASKICVAYTLISPLLRYYTLLYALRNTKALISPLPATLNEARSTVPIIFDYPTVGETCKIGCPAVYP